MLTRATEQRSSPYQPLTRAHPAGIAGLWFSIVTFGGNDLWCGHDSNLTSWRLAVGMCGILSLAEKDSLLKAYEQERRIIGSNWLRDCLISYKYKVVRVCELAQTLPPT